MGRKFKRRLLVRGAILVFAILVGVVSVWLIASGVPSTDAYKTLVSIVLLSSGVVVLVAFLSIVLLISYEEAKYLRLKSKKEPGTLRRIVEKRRRKS